MDTISLTIYGNEEDLKNVVSIIERKDIRGVKVLRRNLDNVNIKLSYPKYFADTNAYLVTSERECYEVQEHFIEYLVNSPEIDIDRLSYKLNRVDIPFTFLREEGATFNSYTSVFYYMGLIAQRNGIESIKSINNFIDGETETLIYSDQRSAKSSNKKLIIYNQEKRLKDSYDSYRFNKALEEFPELPRRIRLEMSKRVFIKTTEPLISFKEENILGKYYQEFKEGLLVLLNTEVLNRIMEEEKNNFIELLGYRRCDPRFTWRGFVLLNYREIMSYQPLREAMNHIGISPKGIEQAVTRVRSTLKQLSNGGRINRLDTIKRFINIKKEIESQNI